MSAFSTFSKDATRAIYESGGAQASFQPLVSNPGADPVATLVMEPELTEPTEVQYSTPRPDFVRQVALLVDDVGAAVEPGDTVTFSDGAYAGQTWVVSDVPFDAVQDEAEITVYVRLQ